MSSQVRTEVSSNADPLPQVPPVPHQPPALQSNTPSQLGGSRLQSTSLTHPKIRGHVWVQWRLGCMLGPQQFQLKQTQTKFSCGQSPNPAGSMQGKETVKKTPWLSIVDSHERPWRGEVEAMRPHTTQKPQGSFLPLESLGRAIHWAVGDPHSLMPQMHWF